MKHAELLNELQYVILQNPNVHSRIANALHFCL
jgi:hypothetical protein